MYDLLVAQLRLGSQKLKHFSPLLAQKTARSGANALVCLVVCACVLLGVYKGSWAPRSAVSSVSGVSYPSPYPNN